MVWIHVGSGLLAIAAGFVALYVRKGGALHRASGRAFGYAMVAMTVSAGLVAAFLRPNPANVVAATVTLYLVATGWLTVKLPPAGARRWVHGLAAFGALAGAYGLALGYVALQTPTRSMGGVPGAALVIFGLIAVGSVAGDLRWSRRRRVDGPGRLLRHLWRMTAALWIATGSFFLGQADEFPRAIRATGLLPVPLLLVTVPLLYWVMRQSLATRRARRTGDAAASAESTGPMGEPARS